MVHYRILRKVKMIRRWELYARTTIPGMKPYEQILKRFYSWTGATAYAHGLAQHISDGSPAIDALVAAFDSSGIDANGVVFHVGIRERWTWKPWSAVTGLTKFLLLLQVIGILSSARQHNLFWTIAGTVLFTACLFISLWKPVLPGEERATEAEYQRQ